MSAWCPPKGRAAENLAALLAGRGFAMGVNLVWLVATVRLFTQTEAALLAFSTLAATWLDVLKGLGMSTWLIRQLPSIRRDQPALAARMIRTYIWCSVAPLAAGTALTWAGALAIRPDLAAPDQRTGDWTLALLGLSLQSLASTFLVILQCFGEMRTMALWNAWFSVAQRLVPVGLAILWSWRLPEFLLATCLLTAASLLPAARPLRTWLADGQGVLPWREFWPDSRHYYSSAVLRFGAMQLDQLLVAIFFQAPTLVTYFVLRRFYSLAVVFVSSCVDAAVPALAANATSNPEAAYKLLSGLRAFILLAGTLAACLTAANGTGLLEVLLGPVHENDAALVVLFSMAALAYGVYSVSLTGEAVMGSAARSSQWVVVALLANVMSIPLLAGVLGANALPMSLVIGFLAGSLAASWGSELPLTLGKRIWVRLLAVVVCGAISRAVLQTGWPAPLQVLAWNGTVAVWLLSEYGTGGFRPVAHYLAGWRPA